MSDEKVLTGQGPWRVTLEDGGIVKFECWDTDDKGNTIAYYSAGATRQDAQGG